jgi:4-amino-4-deoxy-L-arabinose transferase-like glycosyltransferase
VVRTRSGEARTASPALGWQTRVGIGAAALVARGIHLWQIHDTTFYTVLVGDAKAYDRWALDISGGNWLGSGVFYQAPLYPYLLAVFYRVFGHDLTLVRLFQAIGGAAACVLLATATTRFFGRRAGITAGLLLAFYPPAIFFDGIIQKSALDALLVCTLIWLVSLVMPAAASTAVPRWSFWLGAVLGALVLTRENALVLVPVLALWIARSEGFSAQRRRHLVAFAAGVVLLLAPVLLRNATVGGGLYLTTSQAGPNFYIGNNPAAHGMYQPLRVGRGTAEYEQVDATELAQTAVGHPLTPGEVSAYWMRKAGAFIVSQPAQWLALTG